MSFSRGQSAIWGKISTVLQMDLHRGLQRAGPGRPTRRNEALGSSWPRPLGLLTD